MRAALDLLGGRDSTPMMLREYIVVDVVVFVVVIVVDRMIWEKFLDKQVIPGFMKTDISKRKLTILINLLKIRKQQKIRTLFSG